MICCASPRVRLTGRMTRRDAVRCERGQCEGCPVSSRSEVCSSALCSLVFPCASSRFASCFRRGELAHRIASRRVPTPDTARRRARPTARSRLPRRFRPDIVVSFGVSLEMKLANQAVAEHARAEGEGRARSGLHAE